MNHQPASRRCEGERLGSASDQVSKKWGESTVINCNQNEWIPDFSAGYIKKLEEFRAAARKNWNETSLTHGLNSCPLTHDIEACAPSASRQQCKLTVPLSILEQVRMWPSNPKLAMNNRNDSHILKTRDSHNGPWFTHIHMMPHGYFLLTSWLFPQSVRCSCRAPWYTPQKW